MTDFFIELLICAVTINAIKSLLYTTYRVCEYPTNGISNLTYNSDICNVIRTKNYIIRP